MKVTLLLSVAIIFAMGGLVNGWHWPRWRGHRRRTPPTRNCTLSSWSSWCNCSHECGSAGIQSRTRYKTGGEGFGRRCWGRRLRQVRPCNRDACQNGGTPWYGHCFCQGGWTGTCCEKDICSTNPCQHTCTKTGNDSYACSCHSCYTKLGNRCELKKCKIGGICYEYGTVNPRNQCQNCQRTRETAWANNDTLSCSDGNLCTSKDTCVSGVCRGKPFTCKSCESCDGRGSCTVKTGHCVIEGKCYENGDVRQGNPCQWCDANESTTAWTNRDGFLCDDGDSCTKTDTCQNGQCRAGTSFTCNEVCQYCDGNECSSHSGYGYVSDTCTCKIEGIDYDHQEINPENECQWCDLTDNTTKSSSDWSNKPTSPCNDSNSCTKEDTCQNGRCSGTQYSCQSEYPQSSCIERSECVGDGTCKNILKSSGTICRPAVDFCDQAGRCDGELETCLSEDFTPIQLSHGEASLTKSDFENNSTFQSNTDQLYLKLSNFYVSCGDLSFEWSLLEASDEACVIGDNGTSLSSDTDSYILTGLSLKDSETYKVAVQAMDIRGRTGSTVCTNSVTIDTSKPVAGWVDDGLGSKDLEYQSNKVISATWGGFQTTNGVAKYEVAVYSKPMDANEEIQVRTFTSVGEEDSFTKLFSTITDGSNVTTKVRAYTQAGLYTEITSNGVIVDTSKPFPGLVADGPEVSSDRQYANWTNTYDVSWEAFTDPHTPITEYKVGVGPNIDNLATSSMTSVGLKTSFQLSGLSLRSEDKRCAIVEGINAAGLRTQAFSNCVTIDHDAPLPGKVNDGEGQDDIDFQSDETTFHANWDGFLDSDQGSGIGEYRCMLTDENDHQTTQWISAGLQNDVSITGLNLVDGNTYYITVRGIDRAGNYIDVKSDGVFVDTTPPTFTGVTIEGTTREKNGETVVFVQDGDPIVAAWPQLLDEHSGMKKYQWSIAEGNENPTEWKDVPGDQSATSAVFRSISLTKNKEYRLTIRGINNAGLFTDIQSPMIISVDTVDNKA